MIGENLIKLFLNNYFGFNRQQRNGLAVLCAICLLLLAIRLIYPYFITPAKIEVNNLPLVKATVDSVENALTYSEKSSGSNQKLFVFNPNTVNQKELMNLGFSEKTAGIFLKFRKKGFVFKQKSDLKKVYGVSDELYAKLQYYILLENEQKKENQNKISEPVNPKAGTIELNGADSLKLTEINGIGPAFAKRILKYRALLGGFISVEQLKEVYGFTEEMYDKISKNVSVNSSMVTKINLNGDDFKTINKHPYISYEHTKQIFEQKKNIPITAEVLKEILNDDVVFEKLKNYVVY